MMHLWASVVCGWRLDPPVAIRFPHRVLRANYHDLLNDVMTSGDIERFFELSACGGIGLDLVCCCCMMVIASTSCFNLSFHPRSMELAGFLPCIQDAYIMFGTGH